MRGSSIVQLIGALTKAAELRYTPGGLAILEVNVGGNQEIQTKDGVKSVPFYVRSKVMGAYAEALADDMTEGAVVAVDGRLDYRSWETPEGQKRSAVEVFANSITRLDGDFEFVQDSRGQNRLVGGTNAVTLMGNLTRDPEMRYTPGGDAVTKFTVAINEKYSGKNGEVERTHYLDVTAWRELAEKAAELGKGAPVRVTGRITNESWEDADGNKRYATRIEAAEVYAVARPGKGSAKGKEEPAKATKGLDIDEEFVRPVSSKSRLDLSEEFPPEENLPF